jgi:uncharacterized membrane protein
MTRTPSRLILAAALFALSVLFAIWFHDDRHRAAALVVFTLPPLLALLAVLRGGGTPAFWSGVFGLFWFSHGVMVAWSRPPERGYAWGEIVLALIVVVSASWPGLQARFGKRRNKAPE